ncbi:SMC_prok_B domain-containing protein [Bacillus phage Bcp1]|uniref:SMC_prok_B domain-containing protein n=1 Tax=Bacillus phage Bcp1 TaxID=584892 RepID=X2JUC9_9CAUD|nr:SMC_prok_B domain-containing protein [Bacillus phage Bcp1]AHN66511.1 SMC_prok_B domain-containing protein [Bacillus phage Bcp1]
MKHFEELEYLDMAHLEFATKYLKRALSYNTPLDKALSIGTVVECNTSKGSKLGTVVGYSCGKESILFEDPEAHYGHRVVGSEYMTIKKVDVHPFKVTSLMVATNRYLMNNQFKISTAHQKIVYQHWRRTGKFEYDNPIADNEREKIQLQSQIEKKRIELQALEESFANMK